jgi:SagB-type dehydrogenase family enzyme
LPESIPLRMALGESIRRRRSVRRYTGDPLPLAYLATICRASCGVTVVADGGEGPPLALRSAPSAGGLYPIELHVVALRVEGLPLGVFAYDPRRDLLWQSADEDAARAVDAAVAAPEEMIMRSAACAIALLIARPWRVMRKYGARGMRHVMHEAGAISEHVHLASVALGVGSVDCASLYDDEVHEALGIDGLFEALVHGIFLGIPG